MRVVALMPGIRDRFIRAVIVGPVDRSRQLLEHRSRAVELQAAPSAPGQGQPLKIGSQRRWWLAAQGADDRLTVRKRCRDFSPRTTEERPGGDRA